MSALEGLNGEFKEQILHLEGDIISVGRSETNALRLTDSLVSGSHCAFIRMDEQWTLKDYESTNGTQVNGQLIDETTLYDNDVVTIGNSQFRFLEASAGEGSALIDSDLIEMKEGAEVTQAITDFDIEEALRRSQGGIGPPPVPAAAPSAPSASPPPVPASIPTNTEPGYREYESAIYRAPVEETEKSEFLEVGESALIDDDDDDDEDGSEAYDDDQYESAIFRSPGHGSNVMEDVGGGAVDAYDDYDDDDDDDEEDGLAEWLERPSIANTSLAIATSAVLMLLVFVYLSRVI